MWLNAFPGCSLTVTSPAADGLTRSQGGFILQEKWTADYSDCTDKNAFQHFSTSAFSLQHFPIFLADIIKLLT
jgi:hypothetical protein